MSILEILEAHRTLASAPDDKVCACDRTWRPNAEYRAHLAQVLEQHEREAKAEALEEAYYYGLGRTGHSLHRWLRDRAAQLKETP